MGIIADTLAATMRDLAASDARLYRGLDAHLKSARRLLNDAEAPALPPGLEDQIAAAINLLEANGYKITPP